MESKITQDQLDTIAAGIRRKYAEVAENPEGRFHERRAGWRNRFEQFT